MIYLSVTVSVTVDTYKMNCANVENFWLEVLKQNKKYIIGGVYRHPNSNVKEFTASNGNVKRLWQRLHGLLGEEPSGETGTHTADGFAAFFTS